MSASAPSPSAVPALSELLGKARSLVLTGHEHPDGDVLGSQVGLYHLATTLGYEVKILNPDPPAKQVQFLSELAPLDVFRRPEDLDGVDAVVQLDCSETRRLGALGRALDEREIPRFVIDHHVGSAEGDHAGCFIDTGAAATGELILRLYRRHEQSISLAAAEGLFVALAADTGWFRYSNTSAEVLAWAAELSAIGVRTERIDGLMHRQNHADSVELLRQGLAGARMSLEGRFGSLVLERAYLQRASEIGFELDRLMEPLRAIAGIEVVAMVKQVDHGLAKVSLRSEGPVDVQRIAKELGGGGHKKAAGATVTIDDPEQLVGRIQDRVAAALLGETAS